MLKLRRHIGQLLARSTHGFKQLLCSICPQGSNWAIWLSSLSLTFDTSLSGFTGSAASGLPALSPRSPKQTMQVSDMDRYQARGEKAESRHEERFVKCMKEEEECGEEGAGPFEGGPGFPV